MPDHVSHNFKMKKIFLLFAILISAFSVKAQIVPPIDSARYAPKTLLPTVKNAATTLTNPRIAVIRIAITSSPQTVDISGTGFSNVYAVIPQGENNTTTVASMPNCSLKSFTATSAIINTTVGNTGVVGLLAGLVIPTTFTGMYVDLIIVGN